MGAAAADGTKAIDRDVAYFAAHADHAMPYPPTQDDAAADARAKRDHGQRIDLCCASGAKFPLCDSSGVGIFFEEDRHAGRGGETIAQRIAIPAGKVRQQAEGSPFKIQWTGAADADPGNQGGSGKAFNQGTNAVGHVGDHGVRTIFDTGAETVARQRQEFFILEGGIEKTRPKAGTTQVNTDREIVGGGRGHRFCKL